MQNLMIQTTFINNCLGYNRHDCLQALLDQDIESITFAYWLAIPSQQLLLTFRHQRCVAIDSYKISA